MFFSIWRNSHFLLAIVASLFLLVASITGVILAVEPIANKAHSYKITHANELTLSETLTNLNAKYNEILSISNDRNGFVSVSAIVNGKSEQFYVDPYTGNNLGSIIEKAPLFKFTTSLHRSLFLKSTGRFIIGLVSFLLLLIAVSGIALIAKRQGGFRNFFAPVVRENFSQFNHVVYSRITLLPIIVISLSGLYLSLLRFNIIPENQIVHEIDHDSLTDYPKKTLKDFEFFNNTTLGELKELEYPFSDFVEDYYTIRLNDRELIINQFNGEIIAERKQGLVAAISSLAKVLHTGEGSIIWSIVLGLASLMIPFFFITGFIIFFKRPTVRIKNKFVVNECSHVILVGTEGNTTLQFANEFHRQLQRVGIKSYLGLMNEYGSFRQMEQLFVFAATYGQGEAPASADRFKELVAKHRQTQAFMFSVIGFGSTAYPNFCQFAHEAFDLLKELPNADNFGEVHTINNQSFEAFSNWANRWAEVNHLKLELQKPQITLAKRVAYNFEVVDRIDFEKDDTFLLTLKNTKRTKVVSGDLLSIVPEEDGRERLYSIGNLPNNTLVISVKKQPNGICSNRLGRLERGDAFSAGIVNNRHFYLPENTKDVVLIATGAGIGPFLGMIATNNNQRKLHLYWGGRTPESLSPYKTHINEALLKNSLHNFSPAYSQLQAEKVYVQHLVNRDAKKMVCVLKKGGCVMICGSIAMQSEVMSALQMICKAHLKKDLSFYQKRKQIKMDCY